ncbi:hypothetical protein PGT21_008470 [Puccinia graminis f. sp. tritici]|uniref:Uncharacterized protein n=1 Tax=Puccinia graminis f. sp. tritici TaxID=56615 RepID=A0A5B0N5N7_PUCGR|nr:hypothetical protein PGT21_008470 [Puccinia graminis f. sp. tritici]
MARAYQFICSTKINPSSNGNDRLVITASSSKKIRLHYFLSLRDEVSLSRPANRLCETSVSEDAYTDALQSRYHVPEEARVANSAPAAKDLSSRFSSETH